MTASITCNIQGVIVVIRHVVYLNGVHICPKCSGMMKKCGGEVRFRCLDCDTRYEIVDVGQTEKEFVLEERGTPCRNENRGK